MHTSRLTQLLIDVPAAKWEAAITFWSGALGLSPQPDAPQSDDRYLVLGGSDLGLRIVLQRVENGPAFHVDIEADDIEAEVRRLEALGATRKKKVHTWWVMQAPGGHDFCVIRPQQGYGAGSGTRTWPGDAKDQ